MNAAAFLRLLSRDSRGTRGRLLFFTLCLAVGVCAVVAVAALADSVERSVRERARPLLAADVALESNRPLPPELRDAALSLPGARTTDVAVLPTMAAGDATGRRTSELVELKAVGPGYPFYGRVETRPRRSLSELLRDRGAVVEPVLLDRLGLDIGDALRLGEASFAIRGVVEEEPDRQLSPFSLGPRVFIAHADLGATGLDVFGSRIDHRLLVRIGAGADAEFVAARLRAAVPAANRIEVETYRDAQPGLRDAIARVERFLGLVALLALLLGGVGVAQSVRSLLESRLDGVAILKCLGMQPRTVLCLYLGQCLLLGLSGSVLGGILGLVVQQRLPRLVGSGLVPLEALRFWQPWALVQGVALGLLVSVLLALPTLLRVLRVPPLRALRREAEPLPADRRHGAVVLLVTIGGVGGLAAVQAGSVRHGLLFTGTVVAVLAVLAVTARLLEGLAARLRVAPLPVAVRYGAASLARPASGVLVALVSLGLGILVVLTTVLVERHLADALEAELPQRAPSTFFVDVQPDQWPGLRRLLLREGATEVDSVPVVMARLTHVEDTAVEQLAPERDREGDWALTREQRLTYADELPDDNRLVAGELWSRPEVAEVSVERDFAEDLGVALGDHLVFDVQGVPLELLVSSLRAVDWRSFRINFFLLVEPGVLEDAPQNRLAAARLPPHRRQHIQDRVTAEYPNVTVLDVRRILDEVVALLRRLARGVRFFGGFTALAGLVILIGVVATGAVERGREVALFKTLGFTPAGVAGVVVTELVLVGLVAAVVGAIGASAVTWVIVVAVMDLDWNAYPTAYALVAAAAVACSVLAGLLTLLPVLRQRPLTTLRRLRQ